MLTLDALKTYEAKSEASSSSSLDVKLTSMSGEIPGKFGTFRTITINDKQYAVDAKRIKGSTMFTPNCEAVITLNQYKNAAGVVKTVISELSIKPKQACGFFVMS